jgi:hypothetical protein
MAGEPKVQIAGLSELDLLELEEELPDGGIERVGKDIAQAGEHGDLGLTVAVVVLTAAAIHGLAVWLAKRDLKVHNEYDLSFERHKDGRMVLKVHRVSQGAVTESPDAAVVEALKTDLSRLMGPIHDHDSDRENIK